MMDFQQYIHFGLAQGAEELEIYLSNHKSEKLQVFKGEVDSLLSSRSCGIAIRIFTGGKMGFTYTSNLSDEGIKTVITEAIANAKLTDTQEKRELPELYTEYPALDVYNPALAEVAVEEKINLALAIEKAALDYDSRIIAVPTVAYHDEVAEIRIINSKGLDKSYMLSYTVAYAYAMGREGDSTQTGIKVAYGRTITDLDPTIIGTAAAKQAVSLLGAKPVPSNNVPVIFNPYAGTQLASSFVPGFLADKVQKGKSLFKGKLEQVIASPVVTLIDDGLNAKSLYAAPFDDEGVPAQTTVVVEQGVLKSFLYDSHTAKIDGVRTTGNARKLVLRELPEPSTSCFFVKPGNVSLEEMIAGIKEGFLAVDLTGTHSGTNPVSGDFSVGANGFWIKDGKLDQPVREVTVAGNFGQVLKDIVQLGNDLEVSPNPRSLSTPSMLVKELAVSGS